MRVFEYIDNLTFLEFMGWVAMGWALWNITFSAIEWYQRGAK